MYLRTKDPAVPIEVLAAEVEVVLSINLRFAIKAEEMVVALFAARLVIIQIQARIRSALVFTSNVQQIDSVINRNNRTITKLWRRRRMNVRRPALVSVVFAIFCVRH